jgi:uncharacterized protein YukE
MAKAVVDPEELRQFAMALKKFTGRLNQDMTAMQGKMLSLGQTWRDQEHDKFAGEFDETMRAMAKFSRAAEAHIPFLLRKAERIEEYLRQR